MGLPRVLEFWDSMPFWSTFFRALGYGVRYSHPSSRKQYESGLQYVASDTICFPAKLVHGHVLDLSKQGVDRIFLPISSTCPQRTKGEEPLRLPGHHGLLHGGAELPVPRGALLRGL